MTEGVSSGQAQTWAKSFGGADGYGEADHDYAKAQAAGMNIQDKTKMKKALGLIGNMNQFHISKAGSDQLTRFFELAKSMGLTDDGGLSSDDLDSVINVLSADPKDVPSAFRSKVDEIHANKDSLGEGDDVEYEDGHSAQSSDASDLAEESPEAMNAAESASDVEASEENLATSSMPTNETEVSGDDRRAARKAGTSAAEIAGQQRRDNRDRGDSEDTTTPMAETTPEAMPEPMAETTPAPMPEPMAETTPEAMPEPVAETTPEAMPEPMAETTPAPMPEPMAESTPAPMPEPVAETTPAPMPEPMPETTPEPAPTISGSNPAIADTADDESLEVISEFKTIDPGEGPSKVTDENGFFMFNRSVDDSFLPPEVRTGMKQAVDENFDKLAFFKENFKNKDDAYKFLVHMANLESGRGNSLHNEGDAAGSGTGGSSGFLHLHNHFGYQPTSFGGAPLNTEGWTQQEALSDYKKYTTLAMRHLNGGYEDAGGTPGQEGMAKTMGQWWLGKPDANGGGYYLSAVSGGNGVNHNTGSIFT